MNKTFTRGLYDMMVVLTDPQGFQAERALNAFGASFVSNALNQANGDEMFREARTLTDAFLSRTHLYNKVDPKRTLLGEPVVRPLPKYDPLGLTESDTREIDVVMQEITRLAIINQSVSEGPTRIVPGPNKIDLSRIPYQEGQSLFDRWVELTGEVKISRKTLREKLLQTFESHSYQRAPDGFIRTIRGTKTLIIRKIISAYRKKALGELTEITEIIRGERRGQNERLKGQVAQGRQQLFDHVQRTEPLRLFERSPREVPELDLSKRVISSQ